MLARVEAAPKLIRRPEVPSGFSLQEVKVAGNRGACGGVEMTFAAVDKVMSIVPEHVSVWTTNHPVNFPPAFERYGDRLRNAQGDISAVPDNSVCIISAHGFEPKAIAKARERGVVFIDTTCAFVHNEHTKVIRAEADRVPSFFLGEENHPETRGVVGQVAEGAITVFDPTKPIPEGTIIPDGTRVFAKTTNDPEHTAARLAEIKAINDKADTSQAESCYALENRHAAGKKLIVRVNAWMVVGDESSHNAKGIRDTAMGVDIPRYLVRGPEDIDWEWFGPSIQRLGVSAAASVPEDFVQQTLEPFRLLGVPIVEMPQTVEEKHRIFMIPKAQIAVLQAMYPRTA